MWEDVIEQRTEEAVKLVKENRINEITVGIKYDMPTMHGIIMKVTGNKPKHSSYKQRQNEMIRAIKKAIKEGIV